MLRYDGSIKVITHIRELQYLLLYRIEIHVLAKFEVI